MELQEELYQWVKTLDPDLPEILASKGVITITKSALEQLSTGFAISQALKSLSIPCSAAPWLSALAWLQAQSPSAPLSLSPDPLPAFKAIITALWLRASDPPIRSEVALSLPGLETSRQLGHSRTCLEYLLLSFCQQFGVTVQQAAGLLTQGGKYFAYILGRGFKGDPKPVISWSQAIWTSKSTLITLIKQESDSLSLILPLIRPGLLSHELDVVRICSGLITEISREMKLRQEEIWTWFQGDLGGVDAAVTAARRFGKEVMKELAEMMLEVGREHTAELMAVRIKAEMQDFEEYIRLISELISQYTQAPGGLSALRSTQLLSSLITVCLSEADSSPKKSLRLTALNLASSLWSLFPEEAEKDPSIKSSILALFKRGCRDRSPAFSHSCIAQLFHLLDFFVQLHHTNSGVLFNMLIAVMLDSFAEPARRSFLLSNFRISLERSPGFPLDVLISAVAKQWGLREELDFDLCDLEFFVEAAKAERLSLETAVVLGDLLGRAFVSKTEWATALRVPFLLLLDRFQGEETFREFVYRFSKVTLNSILSADLLQIPQRNSLPRYMSQPVRLNPTLSATTVFELTAQRHLKHMVLDLVDRCCKLQVKPLNEKMKELVAGQAVKYRRERGNLPKGWIAVLNSIGNSREILNSYEASHGQIVQRVPSVPHVMEGPPVILPLPATRSNFTERKEPRLRNHSSPFPQLPASSTLLKAPSQPLLDLSCLETTPEDREQTSVLFRKFGRMLKQLFKTYAGTGFHKKVNESFTGQGERTSMMSESEFSHLIRDLGVSQALVSKVQLIGLLNNQFRAQPDSQSLTFPQFQDLLLKTALLAYSLSDISGLPAVFSLGRLFACFRANVIKQFDVKMYDEPWLMPGDQVVLRKLNSTLATHPDTPLPPGFHKAKDQDIAVNYHIPPQIPISEAQKASLEVLDSLLATHFGVHVLEPMVEIVEIAYVVGEFKVKKGDLLSRKPTVYHMPDSLRLIVVQVAQNQDFNAVQECAMMLDDLILALENGYSTVIPQHRPGVTMEKRKKLREIESNMRQNELERENLHRQKMKRYMLEVALSIEEKRSEERKETQRQQREDE